MNARDHHILSSSKLDELKNFILKNDNDLGQYVKDTTVNANSVGEIWRILFSTDSFDLYFKLVEEGIYPTIAEMNEIDQSDNVNAWYWLASRNAGIPVFHALLDRGILPTTEALSEYRTTNNTNAWYWLAGSDARTPVFQALLDRGILPTTETLAECRTTDNTNAWYWLAGSDARTPVFQALLDRGILPTAVALAQCCMTDNTNAWYWLAGSNARIPMFQALLDRGILPTAEALAECCTSDNTNAWYWLAGSDARIPMFQALMDKGILPATEALAKCRTTDNKSAWYWMARNKTCIPGFQILLDKNIFPSLDSANEIEFNELMAALSNQSVFGNKIRNRLEKMRHIKIQYNIHPQSEIMMLFSQADVSNFHGFLYLIYLMTARDNPVIQLPLDIWFLIGEYVLPLFITGGEFQKLMKYENRSSFIKYHVMNSIDHYLNSGLSFFNGHNERARSLKQAVKENKYPGDILIRQYHMSHYPGLQLYDKIETRYQKEYVKKVEDELGEGEFDMILRDGYFLSSPNQRM